MQAYALEAVRETVLIVDLELSSEDEKKGGMAGPG